MTPQTYSASYAAAALDRECEDVARTASGRNMRLNSAAFSLGQLVGAGALGDDEVERRLMDAAVACGYVQKDGAPAARNTIRSGLSKGMLDPRKLPVEHHASNGHARPQSIRIPISSAPAAPPQPFPT